MIKDHEAFLRRAAMHFRQATPTNEDWICLGMAVEYLRRAIGNSWTNQNVFSQHKDVERKHLAGRKFFRAEFDNTRDAYIWEDRVIFLAKAIFNLRHVEGFAEHTKTLAQGNLESCTSDLKVFAHLFRVGLRFRIVSPTGKKGLDYDLEILNDDEFNIPCEVKSKAEEVELTQTTVLNSLKQACTQLPNDRGGIIFLKIPDDWVHNEEISRVIQSALNRFFGQSKRVIAVIPRWEEVLLNQAGPGVAFLEKFRVEKNNACRFEDARIITVLEQIQKTDVHFWKSFRVFATMTRKPDIVIRLADGQQLPHVVGSCGTNSKA